MLKSISLKIYYGIFCFAALSFVMPGEANAQAVRVIGGVSVPSDFPELEFDIPADSNVYDGKIFITNRGKNPYLTVFNNDGKPYAYKKLSIVGWDFNLQADSFLTMVSTGIVQVFDDQFNVIKQLDFPDFSLDPHEFLLQPGGNYLLIKVANRVVDMSALVEGGRKNTTVADAIIQEFDWSDNLVFEWNSKDYFRPQDAVNENFSLTFIDYVHMNSIAVDYDGNLIISSRNLSEVTKIDRLTGEIIWRLGGVNNQFQLAGDSEFFSYQHDARPVPGVPNHYTIFDNGNFKNTVFSRVVEYEIDTAAMTATKVWEFRNSPDFTTRFMGSARRLPNGNTIINWADENKPKIFEVTPKGEPVLSANYEIKDPVYRTHKYRWSTEFQKPYLITESTPYKVNLIFNKFGDEKTKYFLIEARTMSGQFFRVDSTANPYSELTNLENNTNYYFRALAVDSLGKESAWSNIDSAKTNFIQPGTNLIRNGDFTDGLKNWTLVQSDSAQVTANVTAAGELQISYSNAGSDFESVKLKQSTIPLVRGKSYVLQFDAWSSGSKLIEVNVSGSVSPFADYSKLGFQNIGKTRKQYKFEFVMTETNDWSAEFSINCGGSLAELNVDDISLTEVFPTGVRQETPMTKFRLYSNYPNPFNPQTKIVYSLGEAGRVQVLIYSIAGELIKTLKNGFSDSGEHHLIWRGRNDSGKDAASGVYIYTLRYKTHSISRKMVLLR